MVKKSRKLKKSKKIFFEVEDLVFNSDVWFFANYSGEELKVKLKKLLNNVNDVDIGNDIENYSGNHIVIANDKDQSIQRIVWVKEFLWNIEDIGIVAHEVLHLVLRILKDRLVPIGGEDNETISYLYEYYFTRILKRLRDYVK